MSFDYFVLPFMIGLVYLLYRLFITYRGWILAMSPDEKTLLRRSIFTRKTLLAVQEVFMESLLHRKMFRQNKMLGYMHMSFALGWFLLIVAGNLESRIYSKVHINPPYYPIFLKYFVHDKRILLFELDNIPGFFRFLMDLLLVFVLSGLVFAFIKRARSKWFGQAKTTRHMATDRLALTSLWLIFPLRFLAESFTAGSYCSGGFFTNPAGNFFAKFLPVEMLSYPAWWAYSSVLFLFFVTLPYSRYMHIPTEVLLIFMRRYGIRNRDDYGGYAKMQVSSCPGCGVCLDVCQINDFSRMKTISPAYFLKSAKKNTLTEDELFNCALCGRCEDVCPVGIDVNQIRVIKRREATAGYIHNYSNLPAIQAIQADVIYFAGCMTHLTPAVKKSTTAIFKQAGVNFWFMDQDGSVCCGRPIMLAGNDKAAADLIAVNKAKIQASGAKTFVTSCPICYNVFKDTYRLDMEVLHHSQYLLRLAEQGRFKIHAGHTSISYHDPCELSRRYSLYDEPRQLLALAGNIQSQPFEKDNALCCGGSIANIGISDKERRITAKDTLDKLSIHNPALIATSCPLCKKTLSQVSEVRVADISEIIYESMNQDISRDEPRVVTKKMMEERVVL